MKIEDNFNHHFSYKCWNNGGQFMNVKNNKRRRESIEKIERAFIEMLQEKEINQITVTDICNATGHNRSTFYANYLDIYDLADKLGEKLEEDFSAQFKEKSEYTALTMFRHIYDNQIFYKTYFKLGYHERHRTFVFDTMRAERDFGNRHINYHIEFFRNGINAMIKLWLFNGCCEPPEEMAQILVDEYSGRR